MPQDISIATDLKSAAVLGASAGLLGAVTVPFLLPSISELAPAEQQIPLPVPLFCVILAIQFLFVYGSLALAGLRLARARNWEPAPLLTALWTRNHPTRFGRSAARAFATGLLCGLVLVGTIALIRRSLPETLPAVLHPPYLWGALLASATASFGEEILCRLFLLSALLRLLPVSGRNTAIAVTVSSLLFALLHAPAAVFLFGGFDKVSPLTWVWIISLNAFVGAACAAWYLRIGIGGAILVHFATDLVWHVLPHLS
jgi:membrane protease YdiL (CAAX protease family)